MSDELVKAEAQPLALRHELSIEEVVARVRKVHEAMERAMVKDHHYGVIPGTDKPSLLKPGAELLNVMFRLDPQYETADRYDGNQLTIKSTCTLWHIPTGQRWGSGQGSCTTRESKYFYRKAKRVCPTCGSEQINKSKFPPKGAPKGTPPGWYCYAKAGGCGQEFLAEDPKIVDQHVGRVPNEDVADTYNTVLKMANKRSLVAAVLNCTAASDIFTQDLEDMPHDPPAPAKGEVIDASFVSEAQADAEGDRLFKTPDEMEREEKIAVLVNIGKGLAALKLTPDEVTAKWLKHSGGHGPVLDPDAITIDALNALLGELRALHASAKSREGKR